MARLLAWVPICSAIVALTGVILVSPILAAEGESAKAKKARTKGAKEQKKEPRPAASTGAGSDITYTGPQGPSRVGPATSTGAGPILDITHTGPLGK